MSDGTGIGSRALVAIGAPVLDVAPSDRPLAGFVTQLIASDRRLPPYRRSGRVDPASASGFYAGGIAAARRRTELDLLA